MIRVGIVINAVDLSWIGGLNYVANLIASVLSLPDRNVQPVLLVSDRTPDAVLSIFPKVETIRSPIFAEGTRLRAARKVLERGFGRDLIAEAWLRRHRIDVLSHSDQLGRFASVPTVGWIADFQHVRMPEFFSAEERAARDKGYNRIADHCTLVVLSSEDARRDLATFAPQAMPRARLLRFVSATSDTTQATPGPDLRAKYELPERYIFLPNQFWAHKNHGVVVEALAQTDGDITVVCTGKTDDRRRPGYFPDLEAAIRTRGVEGRFRILGLVPYPDVKGFYYDSLAVLNPSKFEGWSTSVEEAKSLGKQVILSNIPVHLEQAPARGLYFSPDSPEQLADLLRTVWHETDASQDHLYRADAQAQLCERFREFGQVFTDIVCEAVGGRHQ